MKKTFTILAFAALAVSSFAWGGRGHATIAAVAEKYMTPTTKELVTEFMNGESIIISSSMLDFCRDSLERETGVNAGHTFCVDANGKAYLSKKDAQGNRIKTGIPDVIDYSKKLKDYKKLSPRERYVAVATIVHCVGDFHCPGHARYYPDFDSGSQKVMYQGKPTKCHSLFDSALLEKVTPWSPRELADLVDIYSEAQHKEIIKGDIVAWVEETAATCKEVRNVPAGAVIDLQWVYDTNVLLRSQLCKAGYRLAHLLNTILDPKYK